MTQANTRGSALNLLKGRSIENEETASDWTRIKRRIDAGRAIPIISNSIRYDAIFDKLLENYRSAGQEGDCEPKPVNVQAENLLAQAWAEQIGYPLPDQMDLPRVAQYNRSLSKDDEESRTQYITFLKQVLLGYAENMGADSTTLDELYAKAKESSFGDLVQSLGYPASITQESDPLRVLARLRLPIYVTTDFHDLVERALILEGRQPVTQMSKWAGDVTLAPEHIPDPNYVPSPDFPLVYHVFGLERYPKSMVLSEDDYLDFLVKVTQSEDVEDERAVIPYRIRSTLSTASLVLLGYRLQDWDFRVLFRGIINKNADPSRGFSMIIQLTPDQQYHIKNPAQAQDYLEKYFRPRQFNVAWGGVETFLKHIMNG